IAAGLVFSGIDLDDLSRFNMGIELERNIAGTWTPIGLVNNIGTIETGDEGMTYLPSKRYVQEFIAPADTLDTFAFKTKRVFEEDFTPIAGMNMIGKNGWSATGSSSLLSFPIEGSGGYVGYGYLDTSSTIKKALSVPASISSSPITISMKYAWYVSSSIHFERPDGVSLPFQISMDVDLATSTAELWVSPFETIASGFQLSFEDFVENFVEISISITSTLLSICINGVTRTYPIALTGSVGKIAFSNLVPTEPAYIIIDDIRCSWLEPATCIARLYTVDPTTGFPAVKIDEVTMTYFEPFVDGAITSTSVTFGKTGLSSQKYAVMIESGSNIPIFFARVPDLDSRSITDAPVGDDFDHETTGGFWTVLSGSF
nr:hypothetical protein [Candidatus Sigynarchaeota archaeon]